MNNKKSVRVEFEVSFSSPYVASKVIHIYVDASGYIYGLYMNHINYSNNGEVIDAVLTLLGDSFNEAVSIQRDRAGDDY